MVNLFNIQLFADEPAETGADQKPTEKPEKDTKPDGDGKSTPKYTDDDVDKLINRKFAEWQRQQEKKVSEAERLSKMTAEEKAAERVRALEEKLHGYEVAAARAEMTKQARAMLQDKGIAANDDLLSNLIAENAEGTKAAVENFISLFNSAVEKAVKEALKGSAPKGGSNPGSITKEQIFAVTDRRERQKLMKEHQHLFT